MINNKMDVSILHDELSINYHQRLNGWLNLINVKRGTISIARPIMECFPSMNALAMYALKSQLQEG
jgi:hypothetical protein